MTRLKQCGECDNTRPHVHWRACSACWKQARVRMEHNFGGLMTVKSTYQVLIDNNWCGGHE